MHSISRVFPNIAIHRAIHVPLFNFKNSRFRVTVLVCIAQHQACTQVFTWGRITKID